MTRSKDAAEKKKARALEIVRRLFPRRPHKSLIDSITLAEIYRRISK